MIKGFKEFIMRGNVVDMAVGIVIGAAFGELIKSFTTSFLDPLIKLITGGDAIGGKIKISSDGSANPLYLDYGGFITAIITFVLTAAAIYFFVVLPLNKLAERRAKSGNPDEATNEEKMIDLLEQIANK